MFHWRSALPTDCRGNCWLLFPLARCYRRSKWPGDQFRCNRGLLGGSLYISAHKKREALIKNYFLALLWHIALAAEETSRQKATAPSSLSRKTDFPIIHDISPLAQPFISVLHPSDTLLELNSTISLHTASWSDVEKAPRRRRLRHSTFSSVIDW